MIKEEPKENIIKEKSKKFAVRIISFYKILTTSRNETIMAKQILRSGTSIGANIVEAQHGSSRKDFLNKMYIAFKECNETQYWLDLFFESGYITKVEYDSISQDCEELNKMLCRITKTTKAEMSLNPNL